MFYFQSTPSDKLSPIHCSIPNFLCFKFSNFLKFNRFSVENFEERNLEIFGERNWKKTWKTMKLTFFQIKFHENNSFFVPKMMRNILAANSCKTATKNKYSSSFVIKFILISILIFISLCKFRNSNNFL